jgi:hypothetical protein
MAQHQSAINFSELKELSEEVMDGTDVYVRVDGEIFKATAVNVNDEVTPGTAVILIEIED